MARKSKAAEAHARNPKEAEAPLGFSYRRPFDRQSRGPTEAWSRGPHRGGTWRWAETHAYSIRLRQACTVRRAFTPSHPRVVSGWRRSVTGPAGLRQTPSVSLRRPHSRSPPPAATASGFPLLRYTHDGAPLDLLQPQTPDRFRDSLAVFARRYDAAVRTRILLVLAALLAVVAACSTAGDSSGGGASDLELRPDGIGRYTVGQPADEVIAGVSGAIGGPDADSTDADTPLLIPDCGATGTRVVSWGNLVLFFVDRGAASVFATWSYGFDPVTGNADDVRRLSLVTAEGIGLGASRADLMAAYGSDVVFSPDAALDLETFSIDGSEPEFISGRLPSVASDATIQLLERQPACIQQVS